MDEKTMLRIRANFGMMAVAILFLCTPHVNVIDITPDCIAWLLAALSMTSLAYCNEEIAHARRLAWILCGITTAAAAPMVFSLLGEKTLPLLAEPTMVLVYTLCFGAAECFLGTYIIRKWIAAIAQIGLYRDSKASIRGSDMLGGMTLFFFLLRFAGSFLPELVYLRSTEYLGNVIYGVVIDIRDYRPYLIALCAFVVLVFGAAWAIAMLRYLRGVAKETDAAGAPLFGGALDALSEQHREEIRCKNKIERTMVAFGMLIVGAVFLCHLSVENINFLPDFVGVALMTGALAVLKPLCDVDRRVFLLGIVTTVLGVPYYIVRTWHSVTHHGFWADNILDYFRREITLSPEKQAVKMGLQLDMLLLAIMETMLLIVFFRCVLRTVGKLNEMTLSDGVTLYDSMTKDMMRAEKERFAKQPKTVFVWFCISCGMEVLRALPVFAFVVTPIAAVRVVVNVIFVCVLSGYLGALGKVILYHFKYNT